MEDTEILIGRIDPKVIKSLLSGDENIKSSDSIVDSMIGYLRERETPRYLFGKEDVSSSADELLFKEASDVLEHTIFGHSFKGDIDWNFNPTTDTSRDNEWSWSLFRNIYWQPLARAYAATGEDRYVEEIVAQMESFASAWPAAPFIEDLTFEKKSPYPGHAWRTIEAGVRIYTTWLPCFFVIKDSPAFNRKGWTVFLNMIHDHAEFLLSHYSNHDRSSNWLSMESSALLQLGILFPEFKQAEEWREVGYRRVMHEIKYCFDNDGIHMERTPVYHLVASIAFFQAVRLCRINGLEVPPYAMPILVKSLEFIAALVKPDFSTPMIGDADREDLTARKSDTSLFEGMNLSFIPDDLNELRGYFRQMALLTGREDFLWFSTAGKKGRPPLERNYKMTDAGIYVMRTGWNRNSSYFLCHGVQLERGERSTHSHNDVGHVEISLRGEDILIDSGRYIYNSSCWKDWRHYFLSARAHNTLFVDDHEMGTVPNVSRVRGVRTHCHYFEETEEYQMMDLSHNGYAFCDDPVFHRRRVVRLAGDIFIIEDLITGRGGEDHDFRLYYNFAPGALSRREGHVWEYTAGSGNKYLCAGLGDDGMESSSLSGSEEPKGGWVSFGYPVREPIPQLCFSAERKAPFSFVTLIAPGETAWDYRKENHTLEVTGEDGRTRSVVLNGEKIIIKK